MYWYSETAKPTAVDWRPEVHDSDGLALWTGAGERIWRPLNNPPRIIASAFADEHPRGFGLLQRDRNFDHYLDGVFYERRPSPLGRAAGRLGQGRRSSSSRSRPTTRSTTTSSPCGCRPSRPRAGAAYDFRYRLHWIADEPYPTPLAALRRDPPRQWRPGRHGAARRACASSWSSSWASRSTRLPVGVMPEPVLWASRGEFSNILTEAVPERRARPLARPVRPHRRPGTDPVEMRCYPAPAATRC